MSCGTWPPILSSPSGLILDATLGSLNSDAQQARSEIADSVARVSAELGKPCLSSSYPYGCEGSAGEREFEMARELGLATAVTTRKGLVHTRHQNTLTALPRLSLNPAIFRTCAT